MKLPSDLSLDKPSFLVIAYLKPQNFCSSRLWNRKGRPERLRPLLSLSTSCGLLGWQPKGLASLGQKVHEIKILYKFYVVAYYVMSI